MRTAFLILLAASLPACDRLDQARSDLSAIREEVTALRSEMAKPSQPPSERYHIYANPGVRADTFLLDTETGKVWRLTQYTDVKGQPTVWEFMLRLDTGEQVRLWALGQEIIPQETPRRAPGDAGAKR